MSAVQSLWRTKCPQAGSSNRARPTISFSRGTRTVPGPRNLQGSEANPLMAKVIGSEASIPNAALKPLSFLIGEWLTEGSHPMLPGQVLHGRTSFAWADGGAF